MNKEAGEKNNDKAALDDLNSQELKENERASKEGHLNRVFECLAILQDEVEKLSEENKDLTAQVSTLQKQLAWFSKTNDEASENATDGIRSPAKKSRADFDSDFEKSFSGLHEKLDDIKNHLKNHFLTLHREKLTPNSQDEKISSVDHNFKKTDGIEAEPQKGDFSEFSKNGKQSEDSLDLDDLEATARSKDFKNMLLASLKDHKNQHPNKGKEIAQAEDVNKNRTENRTVDHASVDLTRLTQPFDATEESEDDETVFLKKKQGLHRQETKIEENATKMENASAAIDQVESPAESQRLSQSEAAPFHANDGNAFEDKGDSEVGHANKNTEKQTLFIETKSVAETAVEAVVEKKDKAFDLLQENEEEKLDSPAWLKNEDWEDPFSEKNSEMDDDEFMKSFRP